MCYACMEWYGENWSLVFDHLVSFFPILHVVS